MIIDLIYTILIVLIGLAIPSFFFSKNEEKQISLLRKLCLFHFLVGIAFFFYTNDGGGDAWGYWIIAKEMRPEDFWVYLFQAKGTYFMYCMNYLPANILGMSFFVNTLLYSLLGFIGVCFFYNVAYKTIPFNSKYNGYLLFPLVFFLPNLHFWSAGIGKDTILFLCIGMFVYCLLNILKRLPLFFLSLLLSYLIRPHITLFLVLSFGIAYLFSGKISKSRRIFFTIVLISLGVAILPSVLEFAKIENASIESFNSFSDNKAALLSRSSTGSSVDISSYPYPLKVFSFLYRPLFFDINGIPAVIASFENLVLLLLSIRIFKIQPVATFKAAPLVVKGLFLFLIIGALAFSPTLGNIGIMIRMRNMFLPGMLIYFLWSFSYQTQHKLIKLKRLEIIKKNKLISTSTYES